MKNQKAFRIRFFLAFLTMLAVSMAQSQVTLQAGGGLGVAFPAGDFGGSTMDYYSGTKYGLSTGFNLHGKIRAGLTGITFMGELGYSSLTNKGNAEPPAQGNVELSQKIVSITVGPEYHFKLPAAPLEPYVGANLALNMISGETTFQGVSKVSSATCVP
jgi:outer membrane protein W